MSKMLNITNLASPFKKKDNVKSRSGDDDDDDDEFKDNCRLSPHLMNLEFLHEKRKIFFYVIKKD